MYFEKDKQLDTTAIVNEIERVVYQELKSFGFRKFGRNLHRFVDGDISQVINFQNGCAAKGIYDVLWVNVGIRVPECELRSFAPEENLKKHYAEYECNIRSGLGRVSGEKEREYDLHDPIEGIIEDILHQIKTYVIPAFDNLNSRAAILENRKDYPHLDGMNRHLTLLEESMIWGRLGDLQKAEDSFNQYYNERAQKYKEHEGWKSYRHIKGHLEYLEELADQLQINIKNKI